MNYGIVHKKKGLKRIVAASFNSYKGLIWMLKNEAAFKQEIILTLLLVVLSFFLNISLSEQFTLIAALCFVLFTETINTAIEAVVDRVGLEHHPLSGLAKDLGSAAVLISFVIAFCIWLAVLI